MEFPSHLALNHWHHYKRVPFVGVDPQWRSWLLDHGSLTQRLIQATQGDFFVRKLNQGWQRPYLSEAQRMGIKPGQRVLVREVELVCHGEPWVYARSIFPQTTLTGRLRHLKKLDNRSLGTLLFNDPSMRRTVFEIAALDSRNLKALDPAKEDATLWGRRSLFYVDNKPILVAEIFLSAMKRHTISLSQNFRYNRPISE